MILELRDIKLSFTNARKEVLDLLNGVNLSVEQGQVTALVGGNGAGKTTLFNIISGFQADYTGEIFFNGHKIDELSAYRRARLGIGRLFQGCQLMRELTLMENMKIASKDRTGESPYTALFGIKRISRSEQKKEKLAIDILTRLLGEGNKYLAMLNHKASELSYGEQRLIAIARLLMGNDKLLLLDEPTSGVNPVYIDIISKIIQRMTKEEGLTVLLIEHNMHFVRELADTCAYLDDGVIEKVGPTSVVLDDKEVRNSYLGL